MSKPWEDFQQVEAGPWEEFAQKEKPKARGASPRLEGYKEAGRVLGTAGMETVFGLPDLIRRGAEAVIPEALMAKGERPVLEGAPQMPSRDEMRALLRPQTKGGQAAANLLSSIGGAATGGGALKQAAGAAASIPSLLAGGAAAGAGAEGLAAVAQPEQEIYARLLGGVAGGSVASLGTNTVRGLAQFIKGHGKAAKLTKELVAGITPEQFKFAQELQARAKAELGVNLTLGQILSKSNLATFEKGAATSVPAGQGLTDVLRAQPEQIRAATERVTEALPGQALPLREAATDVQKAATASLAGDVAKRTAITKPHFQAAGSLDVEDAKDIVKNLLRVSKEVDDPQAGQKLAELARSMLVRTKEGKLKPLTGINEINKRLQLMEQQIKYDPRTPGVSAHAQGLVANEIRSLREHLGQMDPNVSPVSKMPGQTAFQEANIMHRLVSEKLVTPGKEGVVGKLAGPTRYQKGKPAGEAALIQLFDRGTTSKIKSDISVAQRKLAQTGTEGKQAFNNGFASWLSLKLSKAAETKAEGAAPTFARSLKEQLFKTKAQRQGFHDSLVALARNNDLPPTTYVKGLKTWMQTVEAAAENATVAGTSTSQIRKSTETIAGFGAGYTEIAKWRTLLRLLNDKQRAKAIAYLSELMYTPNGVETLQKLAGVQPGSQKANEIIGAFNTIALQPALVDEEK